MSHEVNPLFIFREERAKGNKNFTYDDAVDAAKLRSAAKTQASPTSATGAPAGEPTSPDFFDAIKSWIDKTTAERMPGYEEKAKKLGANTLLPGAFATDPSRVLESQISAAAFAPGQAATSSLGKVAQGILPLLMGSSTGASKPTGGETAEGIVGMGANALRSIPGMAIPKVAKAAQPFVAGGLEGILGSAAQQGVDTGSVDPGQAAKSGALNAFFNLLPGYIGKGGRDNAVTGRSDVLENSPFSRFNTAGVKKDFSEIQKSTDNYLQSLERTKKSGTAAPQDYISRKFYREAGFNDSPEDISLLKRLRDKPEETIATVMGDALNFDPESVRDVDVVKLNRRLNKVVDLFGNSKSSEVLKDKAGEIIVSSFLSPAGKNPHDIKRMFEKLEKGGNSAFDKIFTPEQKKALFDGVDATQKIQKVSELSPNFRLVVAGDRGIMSLPIGTMGLMVSPANLATHFLSSPSKAAYVKDVAEMFKTAAKNPLNGGRVSRALTDKLKDALGAREVTAEEVRKQGEATKPGAEASSWWNPLSRAKQMVGGS